MGESSLQNTEEDDGLQDSFDKDDCADVEQPAVSKDASTPHDHHHHHPQRQSTRHLHHQSILRIPPRMVERNLPFHQSRNEFAVDHNLGWSVFRLLRFDWFHVFLNVNTCLSVMSLLILWTLMIFVFAGIYIGLDRNDGRSHCGLGVDGAPISFGAAFAFSLETCTTVGYGLPSGSDAYFRKCEALQGAIYAQMVWSMLFNAFLFAFMFTRIGRSSSRGVQVLFSKQAVVSRHSDGQVRFQVRLYDMDARRPVVEAHVRLYVLTRQRPVPRPLRMLQPDDDLGGMLFLSMPSVASHHIDCYSLLHPPPANGHPVDPSGLTLRQVDSATGGRDDVVCPVCGESYGTHERWINHVRYQKIVETQDEYPVEGTHLSIPDGVLNHPRSNSPTTTDISILREYFRQEISEVVCVVEGIDPLMSGTFQGLQSFQFNDIVFDEAAQFTPCLDVDGDRIRVDLNKFHEIEIRETPEEVVVETFPRRRTRKVTRKSRSLRSHDSFLCGPPK